MKIVYITLCILILLFIISQIYFLVAQKNIEQYHYKVVKKYDAFEVRNYEAALFTSVKIYSKEYKKAPSKGFSVLAGYIFGNNRENKKIAMTSPVAMSIEDTTTMLFLVPKKYDKNTLPKPNDNTIEFKEIPAKKMAAITFGGWANDEKIKLYKEKLILELEKNSIPFSNRYYYLGYNAPMEIFNRKNEIIIELE